MKNYKKNLL